MSKEIILLFIYQFEPHKRELVGLSLSVLMWSLGRSNQSPLVSHEHRGFTVYVQRKKKIKSIWKWINYFNYYRTSFSRNILNIWSNYTNVASFQNKKINIMH